MTDSTTETERWLPVPGYEDWYEVSDIGRVRSRRRERTPGGILKPGLGSGYASVALCQDGRRRRVTVHRLVLQAFVGEPAPGQECRHLDGDRQNNRLTNLAWGSQSENTLDRVRHGTHNEAAKTACPRGHAYARDSRGKRFCRVCQRAQQRAYEQRRVVSS